MHAKYNMKTTYFSKNNKTNQKTITEKNKTKKEIEKRD